MTNSKQKAISDSRSPTVQVLCGRSVSRKLYVQVEDIVAKRMLRVEPGRLYRLQDICGEEWLGLGNAYVRRDAGRCFANMVSFGRFPFQFIQYKRSRTKWYLLRSN